MRTPTQQRHDVYRQVTHQIIAAIESGTGAGTYHMPWHHDGGSTARPTNVASSRTYRGINRLVLWLAATTAGYGSGLWGTYRAWQAKGAQVRKGEKATTVVLWKEAHRIQDDDEDHVDDDHGRRRMFARAFSVFNGAP